MIRLFLKHHKFIGWLTSILFIILVFAIGSWAGINYFIIPKVIIPEIHKYIAANFTEKVQLSINNISFHVLKGFQLHGVKLSGPVVLNGNNNILQAKELDIDLSILPLLKRRIEVLNLDLYGASIIIGRGKDGKWNYDSLAEFIKKVNAGIGGQSYSFFIYQFTLNNSSVSYTDSFSPGNEIEKKFEGVNITYKKFGKDIYGLLLEGHIAGNKAESIGITVDHDMSKNKFSGVLKFHTGSLAEYWVYYLDDILKPWRLNAKNVNINLSFVYEDGVLLLEGQNSFDKGSIRYGKLDITGKAVIKYFLNFKDGKMVKDTASIFVSLDNVSISAGDNNILDRGICNAEISQNEIFFKDLSGLLFEFPASLKGKFVFGEPGELILTGQLAELENDFSLKLFSGNRAEAIWNINKDESNLKILLGIDDLENLVFNSDISGEIFLEDLFEVKGTASGKVSVSGHVSGSADNIPSFNGLLNLTGEHISILGGEHLDLSLSSEIKNGVFYGSLHKMFFYKGSLLGSVYVDRDIWAIELNAEKMNLLKFSKSYQYLNKTEGFLTGNFVCYAYWSEPAEIMGGGYLKFTNCYLWDAPVFSEIKDGIAETAEVSVSEKFNLLEGNYTIDKTKVSIENVFCDMSSISLNIKGSVFFTGDIDIDIDVVVSMGNLARDIKEVLVPYKIVSNAFKNCVDIHVYGKWPFPQHKTNLHPMAFFYSIFPMTGQRADPEKYNLAKYLGMLKKTGASVPDSAYTK